MFPSTPIYFSHAVLGLSSALDLVNSRLVRHHAQTTTIAALLGKALGLSGDAQSHLCIGAALHDIGAISLNREFELFAEESNLVQHAEVGWLLLQSFPPFAEAARLVRHHHTPWRHADALREDDPQRHLLSGVIHLADRVAVQMHPDRCILAQRHEIVRAIAVERGTLFAPELVDLFLAEASRDVFWLEAAHATYPQLGEGSDTALWATPLDNDVLRQLSELFRMIIDFRCKHTATHSKTVAAVAEAMARKIGFSGHACAMMHVAGNLHDLGKLAVPVAILEKPGPLTLEEQAVIRSHPFYTRQILDRIGGLDEVSAWAGSHHEHLDGSGYPARLNEEHISLGARIVAAADVFAALNEDRSYRAGLTRHETLAIMRTMTTERKLDPFLFSLIERDYAELETIRSAAADSGAREFERLRMAADLLQPAAAPRPPHLPQQLAPPRHAAACAPLPA